MMLISEVLFIFFSLKFSEFAEKYKL